MTENEKHSTQLGHLSVSLGWIAVGGAVVGAACLVGFIAVVLVRDTDALAAIALVLAIVTFIVQIIVYLAQATETARQAAAAQRLHVRTMEVAKDLESYARATHATVGEQFDKLLDRALIAAKGASPSSEGEAPDPELRRMREEILREVRRTVSEGRSDLTGSGWSGFRTRRSPVQHLDFLQSWPSPSGMERLAEDGLRGLPPAAGFELRRYALDLAESLRSGVPDGLPADPRQAGIRELLSRDVLEASDGFRSGGRVAYRLSGFKGRAAARLILAPDPVPARAHELFPWLAAARDGHASASESS